LSRIDADAVRAGAVAAGAICLPLAIIAQLVSGGDDSDQPPIVLVLYIAVLVGFVIGGRVAALRSTESPYSSGAVAALLAFVAIQAVGIVTNALRGDEIRFANIVFNAMLAYGCGLLGAGMVVRRRTA
jgi:predicted permease